MRSSQSVLLIVYVAIIQRKLPVAGSFGRRIGLEHMTAWREKEE